LSYDIVKAHGGELKVETKEGEEANFIIHLPVDIKYTNEIIKIVVFILLPVFFLSQVNPLFLEPTKEQADSLRKALNENINDTCEWQPTGSLHFFILI
jgi:signal transduction histidine kinase